MDHRPSPRERGQGKETRPVNKHSESQLQSRTAGGLQSYLLNLTACRLKLPHLTGGGADQAAAAERQKKKKHYP
jgi:hypothetical protein